MLPLHCDIQTFIEYAVAPYVGAWIETPARDTWGEAPPRRTLRGCVDWNSNGCKATQPQKVAPYVGAWIETEDKSDETEIFESHPTWVRGLKHLVPVYLGDVSQSHPTWVRGLKLQMP